MMRFLVLAVVMGLTTTTLLAQVGIGTTSPHTRALLDLQNNGAARGLQVPQVGTGARTAMAADLTTDEIGLIVADTSSATGGFYVWGGSDWVRVNMDEALWQRVGSSTVMEYPGDNVGIGTSNPQHKLSVGQSTADVQPITIRGYSNIGAWKGGGAFGYDQASVILGQLGNVATTGGHSATLGAWTDLSLNPGGGNVGVGTAAPSAKLHVAGSFRLANGSEAAGRVLTSSADGTATWTTPATETDPKVGTLTTNRVPRWGGTALQDAPIYTSGNNVGIGKAPAALFDVGNATGFSVDLNQSIYDGITGGLLAQSFRPTVSGNLSGFEMQLNGFAGDVLSIQMHAGENPSTPNPISPVLNFTYPANGTNWYQVLFSSPIPVVAGQDYHIVMNSVVGSARITLSGLNPLPNGRLFYNFGFWQPYSSTDDLTFRTLMENTSSFMVVDGATGQVGIGTTSPTLPCTWMAASAWTMARKPVAMCSPAMPMGWAPGNPLLAAGPGAKQAARCT